MRLVLVALAAGAAYLAVLRREVVMPANLLPEHDEAGTPMEPGRAIALAEAVVAAFVQAREHPGCHCRACYREALDWQAWEDSWRKDADALVPGGSHA